MSLATMKPGEFRPWQGARGLALVGGCGVAAPVALAAFGLARTGAALAAAALVAAATLVALVRAFAASEAGGGSGEPGARPGAIGANEEASAFRLALDQLHQPLLLVDGGPREDPDARRFIFANGAARDGLRLSRGEGPLSTAIRAPEVLAAVDEALFERAVGLATYRPAAGQERVWRVRAAPIGEAAGSPLALVILADETEIRRAERARANFLANASHELRTPLASLAGFIETLRGHAREDAAAREKFLAIMQGQTERMGRLIDDLMSLSRIELAEHIAPTDRVDFADAVTDVADALQPLARERGVALTLDLPPPGRVILLADRDQVIQVVQNLVENAIKFSPAGGAVAVAVRVGQPADRRADQNAIHPHGLLAGRIALLTPERGCLTSKAVLTVVDRGPGIPRAALPRLTERFYRVDGKRTRGPPGTGLGLAIVKHIVNRHLGGLWVESVEGQGARFEVALPMAPAKEEDDGRRDAVLSTTQAYLTDAAAAGLPGA